MRRFFSILGIIIGGWLALRIFLPATFVTVFVGIVAAVGIISWMTNALGISPRLRKWLVGVTVGILFINLVLFPFLNRKFQWVAQSVEARSLWTSFGVSDWINPNKNLELHQAVFQVQKTDVQNRARVLVNELERLQTKLSQGAVLTPEERKRVQDINQELQNLDREYSKISLSKDGSSGPTKEKEESGRIYVQAGQEVKLPLSGYDKWTKIIVNPPGTKRIWSGPINARVRYTDGTEGPINQYYNKGASDVQFSGPVGEEVILRVIQ